MKKTHKFYNFFYYIYKKISKECDWLDLNKLIPPLFTPLIKSTKEHNFSYSSISVIYELDHIRLTLSLFIDSLLTMIFDYLY